MRIECPACGAPGPELPDHLVPPSGATLRCTACRASFTALPGGFMMLVQASDAGTASPPPGSPSPTPGGAFPGAGPAFASPFVTGAEAGAGGAVSGSGVPSPSSAGGGGFSPGQAAMPELEPGEVLLEQYEIRGVIGRGGRAVVYDAVDRALGEEIALKAVATFGQAPAVLAELAEESRAQRRIRDLSHVLAARGLQITRRANLDCVLLPMDRAEKTLRDWLREGREDDERMEEGLELLRQACRGVSAIHAAGLVHRDLKPENLLLFRDEEAGRASRKGGEKKPRWTLKVADFGLARGFDRLAEARPELVGDGVGTPAYMAPEQVLAAHWKDVKESADLYALGMMLYEFLDGDLPYSGSAAAIREKKLDERLKVRRPAGPAHLAELAMRCLERDPSQRPALAEELERQLVPADPEEESAYREAEGSDSELGWEGFLKSYPEGRHAEEARGRLAALVAEREAKGAAERKARAEADRKAKAEAEKKAKAEAERKAKEEEARRKREAEEARRRAEAERREKAEEDRKARAEAEKKAKAEEERKAKEAAAAESRRQAEAERKAEEERKRRAEVPPSDPRPLEVWTSPKEGLEYVFIPPGQYAMGASPGDDEAGDEERPRHRVRVARGFWLGKTPVTVAAYRRFCDATERLMPEAPGFNPNWQHGEHPIVKVDWDDAVAYCEWAGGRLPAEAEWEYAARAGTRTRYWWGNKFDGSKAWFEDNSGKSTQPVGCKPASPWGLCDVLGNVLEWCADPWHVSYEGAPSEAEVWSGGVRGWRVLRGGSWSDLARNLRVSYRYWPGRDYRYGSFGCRCARDV